MTGHESSAGSRKRVHTALDFTAGTAFFLIALIGGTSFVGLAAAGLALYWLSAALASALEAPPRWDRVSWLEAAIFICVAVLLVAAWLLFGGTVAGAAFALVCVLLGVQEVMNALRRRGGASQTQDT